MASPLKMDPMLTTNELLIMTAILHTNNRACVNDIHAAVYDRNRLFLTTSMLYACLDRLHSRRRVASCRLKEGESHAKQYFSVTDKGRESLHFTLSNLRKMLVGLDQKVEKVTC